MARSRDGESNRAIYGSILIGIGLLLLLLQLFGNAGRYLWPFFIIAPGVVLILLAGMSGSARSLATAGAVVAGIGTILLVQAVFDYYQSWAYAWTLIPFSAGAGMVYASHSDRDARLAERGRDMMRWSAIAFAVLGILFEVLIFDGGIFGGRFVGPLILIVVGSFLAFGRLGHSHDHGHEHSPPAPGAATPPQPPSSNGEEPPQNH